MTTDTLHAPIRPRAVRADTILALTHDPAYPLFASWLPQSQLSVEYVSGVGVDYEFGEHIALVVTVDCYQEPYVSLLRRAVEAGIPTLILADGILEYHHTWAQPWAVPCTLFQPVLSHKIACIGRSQARIIESWGNPGKCEIVGMPKFDQYADLPRRSRPMDAPFRILITTKLRSYQDEGYRTLLVESLADIKGALASADLIAGQRVEIIWRLPKELDVAIGVDSAANSLSKRPLEEIFQKVDAMISTPSTVVLEAMLMGLPVAIVDYCNNPNYVQAAWRITAARQIHSVVAEFINPPPAKLLYQETMLHDALECETAAAPRMADLARKMMQAGRQEKGRGALPTKLVRPDHAEIAAVEARFQPAAFFPEHALFKQTDLSALQAEVAHLRLHAAQLQARVWAPNNTARESAAVNEQTYRLTPHVHQAVANEGASDQVSIWEAAIDGPGCQVVYMQPPAERSFELPTGQRGVFSAAIAMHPDVWNNSQSGACEFYVRVNNRIVLAMAIDPVRIESDRHWHEFQVDVPENPAGPHQVVLGTKQIGTPYFRWAIWREPRFTWKTPTLVPAGESKTPAS